MKNYFGDQDINDTGLDGDKNSQSTNTDYPEFASSNTGQYGTNKNYFYAAAQGKNPHPRTYMATGITNNAVLSTDIRNVDADAGIWDENNVKWFSRMVAGALIIMCGDTQKINIALKCMGFTGIPASPLKPYSTAQAADGEPGWSATSTTILNTGNSRFGELGEIARDGYGTGGTSNLYGYIYSPNATLPSGVTSDSPIVTDSRNTHGSITSRGTGNNRLGIPYAVGLHNRAEYIELKVKEILDYLNLAADPEPFQATVESPDSRTVLLYSQASGSSSSIYTTGYIDSVSGSLYPVATLSVCTAGGKLDTALTLRREPAAGVDVTVPVDDTGAVDWSTSAMSTHPWKVTLNGQIIACAGVVQTLVSGSYVATWKLYIRNTNTSAPSSGQTQRSPAIMEEYGEEFYMNTTSTGVTEITFKTSAGKLQNGIPAEFYKKGAVRVSTILQAAS
jgi:hypothetical protein